MSYTKNSTKYVLITGASSGIGFDLAKEFARADHNVIMVARNSQKLEDVKTKLSQKYPDVKIQAIVCDLSDSSNVFELVAKTEKHNWEVEILVNNAGFATNGFFASLDTQKELAQLHTNVTALALLTKLYLPKMLAENNGKILNVASTAAFVPGPFMAMYYATKAFVHSFSVALSKELEVTGVDVSVLCPGGTKTDFFDSANMHKTRMVKNADMMTSKEVAKQGYDGLMNNQRVIIPGFRNKFLIFMVKFLPLSLILNITAYLDQPSKS